jgi:hypothetical protein
VPFQCALLPLADTSMRREALLKWLPPLLLPCWLWGRAAV